MSDTMNEIDLVVGSMFNTLPNEDRAAYTEEKEWLSDIQDLLREEGIQVDLLSRPGVEIWEGGIEHDRDLYNLQRIAANLENNKSIAGILKSIDSDEIEEDSIIAAIMTGTQTTKFPHLINHQGEGGYYLPADFADPLWIEFDSDDLVGDDDDDDFEGEDPYVSFGSSIGLQRELANLEPMLVEAGVASDSAPFRALKVLRAAADASVANELPIIVW
jgi:hypothetical protein